MKNKIRYTCLLTRKIAYNVENRGICVKIAVCDNQKAFRDQMEKILVKQEEVDACCLYGQVNDLLKKLEAGALYDVILMDIEWEGKNKNGIQYAAEISERYPGCQIILVTSHNDRYSQEIFWERLNLCGYLVKPVKEENLKKLLKKVEKGEVLRRKRTLTVQYKGGLESLPYVKILYLESNAHQLSIVQFESILSVYGRLDTYAEELQEEFVRIHKSYLVNMCYIKRFERKKLILQNGDTLPISRSMYASAKQRYFEFIRGSHHTSLHETVVEDDQIGLQGAK